MKAYSTALLSAGLLAALATPGLVKAQGSASGSLAGSMAAAQPHIDKAKEAAWRPKDGLNDLTKLYETVCAPALDPQGPKDQTPAQQSAISRHSNPPRSEWYQEP